MRVESVPVGIGGPRTQDGQNYEFPPGMESLDSMRALTAHEWAVVVTWDVSDDGRAVPTSVALHALRGQPVTATAWRAVPVSEVVETARRRTSYLWEVLGVTFPPLVRGLSDPFRASLAALDAGPVERGRGRPARFPDEHYREVAKVYVDARKGGSRSPIREVARHFGVDGPGDFRAKGWVAEARRRGYITKGGE